MKPVSPVPRWTEPDASERNVPSELRDALDTLRSEAPSAAQLERMIAGVSLALEAPSGVVATTASTAHGSAVLLKLSAVIAVLAGAAWLGLRSAPETEPAKHSAPAAQPAPALPTQASPAAEPPAPPRLDDAVEDDEATAPVTRIARPAFKREKAPVQPRREEPDITAEIALLRRAKRAIQVEPRTTLELLSQHRAQFTAAAFAEERDALEIEALLIAGEQARADASEQVFRAGYPRSAYLRRIERVRTDVLSQPGPRRDASSDR
jgi:hypothetical protein